MTIERVSRLEERIERLEARIVSLEEKVERGFEKVDSLMRDHFRWILGITMTMWATTMAAIIASLFR
ncbi:MAG: hypothetical protein L0177_09630 [Chloroflexi bacterium]|nr:hypothetical protein [Chloroflexota bacterium]